MRILHVIESMYTGGAERNTATLLGPLNALGVENHLCTLWGGRAYENKVAPFVERHELAMTGRRVFPALPRLTQLARRVDVVHTQLPWANIVGRLAALAARRPSVTTLHTTGYDRAHLAELPLTVRVNAEVVRNLDAETGRTTRRFFAVSSAVKEVSIRALRIPTDRIEVTPCCLDPAEFDPASLGERTRVRAELGWDPGVLAVVTVGRLIRTKRVADAIRAVAEVARGMPVRLYIAGAGSEEAALRTLASGLDAPVTFLGLRDDVPRLLHAADLFAFPTEYEGMPLALLEAMAMGLPCVCSDIIENCDVGGPAAHYFPRGQPSRMADVLRGLLADPAGRQLLGQQARARALQYADPTATAKRFVKSLSALTG
jgi:glycosyltransferase involved in cell wall biosynthesis